MTYSLNFTSIQCSLSDCVSEFCKSLKVPLLDDFDKILPFISQNAYFLCPILSKTFTGITKGWMPPEKT